MRALRNFRPVVAVLFICLGIHGCGGSLGKPLQVVSWTPGEERVMDVEACVVSVTFSAEVDRVRTEEAFSLTTDSAQPPGGFRWEGTTLIYEPYHPLKEGKKYIVTVTTGAEDLFGYSLKEDFILVFFTGEKGTRPTVIDIDPPDRAEITDLYKLLTLTFDTSVNIDSFFSSFNLSPSVKGVWSFQHNDSQAVFTPAEPYTWQEEYTVTLSQELTSSRGYPLAEEFESRFSIRSEREPPRVLTLHSEDQSIAVSLSPPEGPDIIVTSGWEKDSGLKVSFSEEVDRDSAEGSLLIEPEVPSTLSWDQSVEPADMIVSWDEHLAWQTLYRIELSTALKDLEENMMEEPTVCYLYVDGPSSRPPLIERVEFIPDQSTPVLFYDAHTPGNNQNSHIILDTSSETDVTQNPFYLDFYIALAAGAELPFFAMVDNFSLIPENSCVSLQYQNFQVFNPGDDLAFADIPKPIPESNQAVVRLILALTDAWDTADTVSFQVYRDLEDSLGNRMGEDWLWELFDEDN